MKINWNSKYNTIAVYTIIVLCAVITFYIGILEIDIITSKLAVVMNVMQPVIMGGAIAYILNFILKFVEDKLLKDSYLKKVRIKSKRGLGILITYLIAALILYLFMLFVFPQLIDSIVGLINDIPTYITNLTNLLEKLMENLDIQEEYLNFAKDNLDSFFNYTIKVATNLLPYLGGFLKTVASSVWNIVLGIIISIYLLIDKEKLVDELNSEIKKELPDYYLPFIYVFRHDMPLTSIDKVDYKMLEQEKYSFKNRIVESDTKKEKRLIKRRI